MIKFWNTIAGKLIKEFSWTTVVLGILFLFSMLMQAVVSKFEKSSLLNSPQFGINDNFKLFEQERAVLYGKFEYEGYYFLYNTIILLTLFWLSGIVYRKLKESREKRYINYGIFKWIFIIVAVLAIVFDAYENALYYFGLEIVKFYLPWVITLKSTFNSILLAIAGLFILLHFPESGTKENLEKPKNKSLSWNSSKVILFFKGATISILLLMSIGFGLTLLDQGATLVIHLINNATSLVGLIQVIMTVLLINFLATIISHYPEYIQNAFEPSKRIRWHINWWWKIPGIITFTNTHHNDNYYLTEEELRIKQGSGRKVMKYGNYVTLFRYYLGVMTYVAWFYVVYVAFDIFELTDYNAQASVFLWSVLTCVVVYYLFRIHSRDSHDLLSEISKMKELDPSCEATAIISKASIDKVRSWLNAYVFFAFITVLIGSCALLSFFLLGWDLDSFHWIIGFLLSNAFLFVFFRFTRSYAKYVWFNSEKVKEMLRKDAELVFSKDSKVDLILENKVKSSSKWYYWILGTVSSNYSFLSFMRFIAVLSAIYIVSSYFFMGSYIYEYNAIPLTLSALYLFYYLLIFPLKFYFAYGKRQYDEYLEENEGLYYKRKGTFLWALIIIGGVLFAAKSHGGLFNLHKMYYVESNENISIDQFTYCLDEYIVDSLYRENSVTPMIQVTSFGGGLKSNLWTLLTMDALDDRISEVMQTDNKPSRILDFALSLSGVSGGAVGLGNYLVLDYMNRNLYNYNKDKIIQKIGEENILAIDAAGVFGHDLIKQTFSREGSGEDPYYDRSYYAMQRYMKVLSKTSDCDIIDSLLRISLSELWYKMSIDVPHNPALIINTASTNHQPGVSFSLRSETEVFPGYIYLADTTMDGSVVTHKDLSYYNAISTSNRFPIMSPTGQIEDDGFFLDGGYFENSGLMTSNQFLDDLKAKSPIVDKFPIGTVVIINSKSDYIRKFIEENDIIQTTINNSTNTASIIAGITNIDKLPNVLLKTKETYSTTGDALFTIYLPHPISINDIYNVIGGEFPISSDIFEAIKDNNKLINTALSKDTSFIVEKKGLVVPPLARTLSKPAVTYEQAMINYHDGVISQLESVINYISKGVYLSLDSDRMNEEVAILDKDDRSLPEDEVMSSEQQMEKYKSDKAKAEKIDNLYRSLPKKKPVKKSKKIIGKNIKYEKQNLNN
jgi:hypothetical protein